MSFHSPPNWPAPPPGWQPDPDWKPDPSWPPAPPGWVFWTDTPPMDAGATAVIPAAKVVEPQALPDDAGATAVIPAATIDTPVPFGDTPTDQFRLPGPSFPQRAPTAADRFRAGARATAVAVTRLVNPIRALYALGALAGAVLFAWLFVTLRFDAQWNYAGWLWHGVWPVLGMLASLAVGFAGAIGIRRWDYPRWCRRRGVPVLGARVAAGSLTPPSDGGG